MTLPINTIITGDCLEVMKGWPDNSVDAIVTDIPYGIGFMGKEWDTFKLESVSAGVKTNLSSGDKSARGRNDTSPAWVAARYDLSRNAEYQEWCRVWSAEALRIAKPGAFLLCFGGTRTYHRVTCGLEDAGWQIRDCMMWLYGSGFPKSHNISKAIDKAKGAERTKYIKRNIAYPDSDCWGVPNRNSSGENPNPTSYKVPTEKDGGNFGGVRKMSVPATDLAKLWDGYGTALKPAWEPIIVAMKPLDGTFAQNAEKWGVAGLNIDGARIDFRGSSDQIKHAKSISAYKEVGESCEGSWKNSSPLSKANEQNPQGRFPANLILDEESAAMLDEQSGHLKSGDNCRRTKEGYFGEHGGLGKAGDLQTTYGDFGGASRFFYCAKASKAERNAGCGGLETVASKTMSERNPDTSGSNHNTTGQKPALQKNHHPTVKPLSLMEYLCKLLKPPSGHPLLLDPFCGSGTTLMAAVCTGWNYIGIEKEAEYCEIARKRVAWAKKKKKDQLGLFS